MANIGVRTRLAASAGGMVSGLSRRLGRGSGSVIGGRAILAIEPAAVEHLAAGRDVALVSGTNGKTTTTSLLAAALGSTGPVVTNLQGANLLPGLATALAAGQPGAPAALEVDEAWLPDVVQRSRPKVALLLNLSRDQLDRNNEVRRLASRWRHALAGGTTHVVANADDPLVAWGAGAAAGPERDERGETDDRSEPARSGPAGASRANGSAPGSDSGPRVTWVGAGQPWTADASGCPACGGRIQFAPGGTQGWRCTSCQFARPELDVWVEDDAVVTKAGQHHPLALMLPGRCNRANAAMALTGARVMDVEAEPALVAMRRVGDVGGRYRTVTIHASAGAPAGGDGTLHARLLLAKNPAGWLEVFDLLTPPPAPVVVAINARIADGRDPSWLWDVPFERLTGRHVVATGERSRDLAVRLHYAGVEHRRVDDLVAAVRSVGSGNVDVVANYTSFQDLVRRVEGSSR